MANWAERLQMAVKDGEAQLRSVSDSEASTALGGKRWTKKEELGHLIDSATNNRVRFIKGALEGQYTGPVYDGRGWVELGGFANMDWSDLIELWARLNRALATVLSRIPPEKLTAECRVGELKPVTLGFLIEDYVHHMQHHLDHLAEPGAKRGV